MFHIKNCLIHAAGLDLIESELEQDVKHNQIRTIRRLFSNKVGFVKLESLLTDIKNYQSKLKILESELLFTFGTSLVDYLCTGKHSYAQFYQLLEFVLAELKNRNNDIIDTLAIFTWNRFEEFEIMDTNLIEALLNASQAVFESKILDWFNTYAIKEYYLKICCRIPKVFQVVTSILNEVLIISEGNINALNLISLFVGDVMSICQKEQNNFLSLYPENHRRFVSLLAISPEFYPIDVNKLPNQNTILDLILEMYNHNKKVCLLILTHFNSWLPVFEIYLNANVIENKNIHS